MAHEEIAHTREEFVSRATVDRQPQDGIEFELEQENFAYTDAVADVDRVFSRWL